jgi:transcriptional regulator of acetoin/glycerol metabolism
LGRRAGITVVEGMCWTEDSAGTNAIGTPLAIDHAVQVFSAEHVLPDQHTSGGARRRRSTIQAAAS